MATISSLFKVLDENWVGLCCLHCVLFLLMSSFFAAEVGMTSQKFLLEFLPDDTTSNASSVLGWTWRWRHFWRRQAFHYYSHVFFRSKERRSQCFQFPDVFRFFWTRQDISKGHFWNSHLASVQCPLHRRLMCRWNTVLGTVCFCRHIKHFNSRSHSRCFLYATANFIHGFQAVALLWCCALRDWVQYMSAAVCCGSFITGEACIVI